MITILCRLDPHMDFLFYSAVGCLLYSFYYTHCHQASQQNLYHSIGIFFVSLSLPLSSLTSFLASLVAAPLIACIIRSIQVVFYFPFPSLSSISSVLSSFKIYF